MSIPRTQGHPRAMGVMHTGGQPTSGKPRTVHSVVPLQQYAINYYDENGTPRVNILIKVGEKLYLAPQGIEWAASLKPAADWLAKGASTLINDDEKKSPSVPTTDEVDVVG